MTRRITLNECDILQVNSARSNDVTLQTLERNSANRTGWNRTNRNFREKGISAVRRKLAGQANGGDGRNRLLTWVCQTIERRQRMTRRRIAHNESGILQINSAGSNDVALWTRPHA